MVFSLSVSLLVWGVLILRWGITCPWRRRGILKDLSSSQAQEYLVEILASKDRVKGKPEKSEEEYVQEIARSDKLKRYCCVSLGVFCIVVFLGVNLYYNPSTSMLFR